LASPRHRDIARVDNPTAVDLALALKRSLSVNLYLKTHNPAEYQERPKPAESFDNVETLLENMQESRDIFGRHPLTSNQTVIARVYLTRSLLEDVGTPLTLLHI
jgi:hypothetical protein